MTKRLTEKYRLKCNREIPCQNCAARVEQALCKYKDSKNSSRSTASPRHDHEHGDAMQQRIDRLETLVKILVAQDQQKLPLEDDPLSNNGVRSEDPRPGTGFDTTAGTKDNSEMPYSGGKTMINGRHSIYKAANDWSDVIEEVRVYVLQLLSSFVFV
jgi:hypothetical protein